MWCPDGQSRGTVYRLETNTSGGFDREYETKLSIIVEDYFYTCLKPIYNTTR